MADAVPVRFAPSPSGDLQRQAEAYYREKLREAFFGFLIPNLICWAIWFMTGHDGFVWPIFVPIPTVGHLLRVGASKQSIIEGRIEKLRAQAGQGARAPEVVEVLEAVVRTSGGATSGPILSEHEKPEEA